MNGSTFKAIQYMNGCTFKVIQYIVYEWVYF